MTKLAPNISHFMNTNGLNSLIKRKSPHSLQDREYWRCPAESQMDLLFSPEMPPPGTHYSGSWDGPETQPASSDGLLWSSVGKQAKGKRRTSKDSDPWGVTALSQNQQMSLGQTRRGSAQQLTRTLALTWGVAASSEKSSDPTVGEPDGWELTERAQQALLVSEHIKAT